MPHKAVPNIKQSRHWKLYVEQEMKDKNFVRVEEIFKRCLKQVSSFIVNFNEVVNIIFYSSLIVSYCGSVEKLFEISCRILREFN